MYNKIVKRLFDIVISGVALIILSPIYLILAVLVRTKLGSPVIFHQERPGLNGQIFTLCKFRTMTDERDAEGNLLPDAVRLTKFGKLLRTTSLDELPELWNIFKGDMSLIGPRPLLVSYLPYYTKQEQLRHSVRPGLTGLAQVSGRNMIAWDDRIAKDVEYVKNISFLMDIKVILLTVKTVLHHSGVEVDTARVESNFAKERQGRLDTIGKLKEEPQRTIAFYIGSLAVGGAERVATNLAVYFESIGYKVYMVTKLKADTEYELKGSITRIIADITKDEETGSRIGNLRARINKLKSIWVEIEPDMIISFIGKNNLMAIASARQLHIPVVVSVRSDPNREMAGRLNHMLYKYMFGKAAGIVLQTNEACEFFPQRLKGKITVLPNSINPAFIDCINEYDSNCNCRQHDIIAVGRIDDNKNEKMLIDAFAKIENKYPDWKVRLYGGGDHPEILEEYSDNLGLKGRVIFHGKVDDVPKRMQEASIFVLPSKIEGMPNALIEAMTLSMACISTDCPCGGPKDLIKDGWNGYLIKVDDTDALAKRLEQLINDENLRKTLGENASKIIDRLHPNIVNKMWADYVENIIETM